MENNPLKYTDPTGNEEKIVNNYKPIEINYSAWDKWVIDVGNGGEYLAHSSPVWKTALDHPIVTGATVGFASGFLAVASSAALTAFSTTYLGGAGTECVAFCDKATEVNPEILRYSQTTAGGNGRYEVLKESIQTKGWNGPPIDVVKTQEGLTTIDNTRTAIAQELNLKTVPANIHLGEEFLPDSMVGRFGDATTWEEALRFRTANQNPPLPYEGTLTFPKIK